MKTKAEYDLITSKIIGLCIEVHKELGPGLLESVYEICLCKLLIDAGLKIEFQKQLPITFRGEKLNKNFYVDILVEDLIIIELKSVEYVAPIFEAQLLTYLRLADKKLGLLINFNVVLLKDGIKRIINGTLL